MTAAPLLLVAATSPAPAVATMPEVARQHQDRDEDEEPVALQELAHTHLPGTVPRRVHPRAITTMFSSELMSNPLATTLARVRWLIR